MSASADGVSVAPCSYAELATAYARPAGSAAPSCCGMAAAPAQSLQPRPAHAAAVGPLGVLGDVRIPAGPRMRTAAAAPATAQDVVAEQCRSTAQVASFLLAAPSCSAVGKRSRKTGSASSANSCQATQGLCQLWLMQQQLFGVTPAVMQSQPQPAALGVQLGAGARTAALPGRELSVVATAAVDGWELLALCLAVFSSHC